MADLSFCNLCDQSIPDSDLREQTAIRVGDRALCHKCQALLDEQIERPQTSVLPSVATVLGVIALACCFMLLKRIDEMQSAQQRQVDELSVQLGLKLETMNGNINDALNKFEEDKSLLDVQLELLNGGQKKISSSSTNIESGMLSNQDALARINAEQLESQSRLSRIESTMSVVEERVASQRSTQENLRDQLSRLDKNVTAMQAVAPAIEETTFSGEVSAVLRSLQSADPEVRYDALEKLSGIQDPKLLPHIFPLLADPYEFTRFLAAHTLGAWEAKTATPLLIEALVDEVKFVREAAVRALRRITAQSFDYEHDATDEKIQAGYQQWKTWWETNKSEFLGIQ